MECGNIHKLCIKLIRVVFEAVSDGLVVLRHPGVAVTRIRPRKWRRSNSNSTMYYSYLWLVDCYWEVLVQFSFLFDLFNVDDTIHTPASHVADTSGSLRFSHDQEWYGRTWHEYENCNFIWCLPLAEYDNSLPFYTCNY